MKKKKTIQKIVIGLVAVALIAVSIYLGVSLLEKRKQDSGKALPTTQKETQEDLNPEEEVKTENGFKATIAEIENKRASGEATSEELFNLGVAYYNLNNLDEAIVVYNESISKNSQDAGAYGNLANVLRDQEKYKEAETNYRKAMQLNPQLTKAYVGLAIMLKLFEDNKASAIEVLKIGLKNNPEDQEIKDLLENYSQ